MTALWTTYYEAIGRWVRPWTDAHPIFAYPGDGAETLVVAASVAMLVAWVDLWVLLILVRLVRPRWVAWCTPRSRRARVLIALALAVGFLLVLEGLLRQFVAVSPGPAWRPHPLYFWGLPRGANDLRIFYPDLPIHTNRSGFRGDDIPFEKEENEVRVLVTGDSSSFGQGVDQRDSFPSVLERMLSVRYRNRKITVINAGMPGYSLSQSYYLFEEEGLRYHPDLVIVGSHKWSISSDHLANRERIAGNAAMRRLQVWAHESLLYLLLRKQVARSHARQADLIAEDFGTPAVRDDQYVEYCRRFLEIFRDRGISSVYVAPLPQYPNPPDAWHTIQPFSGFSASLRPSDRVALMEWKRDMPEAEFVLSPQDSHFSVRGHASIARQFYDVIVGHHLLD